MAASHAEIAEIRRLDAEGRLPCRVIAQPPASSEDQLRALAESGLHFGQELGPMSRVGPVKIFFDRFVMHRSARLKQPYQGQPENFGGYFNAPAALAELLRGAFNLGFPVAVHVTGDRAIAELVEAVSREASRRKRDLPPGSFVIHGYFAPEGVPQRMADLGLGLAAQPAFLHAWADTLERYVGPERTNGFYPFDRYRDAGVTVAASSDAPIVAPDPLLGLYTMTTRRSASGRAWGPDHAVTTTEAMEVYTASAARLFGWSGFPGELAVGKPADFVVLDRDPCTTEAQELRHARVLATYVSGCETFRRESPRRAIPYDYG